MVDFSYLIEKKRLLRVEMFRYATDELWIPSTSEFKSNKAWKNEHFAKNTRFAVSQSIIVGSKKRKNGDGGGAFLAWVLPCSLSN